jgi:GNAT superfamily N-acetyltransferase
MATEIKILREGDEAVLTRVAPPGLFDNEVSRGLTEEFLGDARHHLAVAIENDLVAGFASAVHYIHSDKRPDLWFNEVAVSPTHQGRGLGKALLSALFEAGRGLGRGEAWVLTDRPNAALFIAGRQRHRSRHVHVPLDCHEFKTGSGKSVGETQLENARSSIRESVPNLFSEPFRSSPTKPQPNLQTPVAAFSCAGPIPHRTQTGGEKCAASRARSRQSKAMLFHEETQRVRNTGFVARNVCQLVTPMRAEPNDELIETGPAAMPVFEKILAEKREEDFNSGCERQRCHRNKCRDRKVTAGCGHFGAGIVIVGLFSGKINRSFSPNSFPSGIPACS